MNTVAVLLMGGVLASAASLRAQPHPQPPLGRAVVSGWLDWTTLAPLPDREGFAAPFAGVSGGALLVAGGANFPDRKPWEGGDKVWSDTVFLLDQPSGTWRKAGKLPRPLGYGVSVTTEDGVLCLGGSDAKRHYADAFLLQWSHGQLHRRRMPSLPTPSANMCGALVGTGVYLAGGTDSPVATKALRTFWTLDLAAKRPRWEALEPCPGPARMLAVAGVHGGAFLLFGGVGLHSGADGRPVRTYLRDAWRYTPSAGWQRLADLPRAAAAAPSPAPWRGSRLLIVSGDDGVHANVEPKSLHPGFPRDVLAYEPRADHWGNLGDSPLSRATVPVVEWQGRAVMANGEVRPGVRSPEVWVLDGR